MTFILVGEKSPFRKGLASIILQAMVIASFFLKSSTIYPTAKLIVNVYTQLLPVFTGFQQFYEVQT